MARILNEIEYSQRRNEILDIAQRLVYTKGYEQMSIQDILTELHISKGAFYHYFDSKPALLEALLDRIQVEGKKVMLPILEDTQLPALDKLRVMFSSVARWKTDRKAYLMALVRVWYADENAIVRQKSTAALLRYFAPLLTDVVRQGIREGTLDTPFPEQAGEVALSTIVGMGDSIADWFIELVDCPDPAQREMYLQRIERLTAAYSYAVERILGAPPGSLILFDTEILKEWIIP